MDHKKKYLGRSSLLFGLLLFLLLGFSSTTCYARTELTDDEATYIWNYLVSNQYSENIDNGTIYNGYFTSSNTSINRKDVSSNIQNFKSYFNNNNTLDFNINNLIVISRWYNYSTSYEVDLYFYNCNNTFSDSLDYLYIEKNQNTDNFSIKAYNPDNNTTGTINGVRLNIYINPSMSTFTFRGFNNTSAGTLPFIFKLTNNYNSQYSTQNVILENYPGIVSFKNTGVIYSNWNGLNYFSEPQSYFLKTLYSGGGDSPVIPDEPIPDTGNTGEITDNNGDVTGQIDLSGIQNGIGQINNSINNQGQAIIDNQNQNTQSIIDNQNNNTEQITDTLTESADDTINNTNITSGDFADIVDFTPITNNQEYTAISNLWYELLTGFSNALTNVNRVLNIEFRGQQYEINLDNFSVFIPASLKVFFGTLCTVWVVIYISKNTKHLVEDIQTASIDNVANKLTEDFESNMF